LGEWRIEKTFAADDFTGGLKIEQKKGPERDGVSQADPFFILGRGRGAGEG